MYFHIDNEKLQVLLKHFYTLTKMRIVVFDDEGKEIACWPNRHSRFCRVLRECPAAKEKCLLCDQEACRQSKKQKQRIAYRCHAGMTEVVTPIWYENVAIGYIMIGQLFQTDDYEKSWAELLPHLSQYQVDLAALKTAYFKKRNYADETVVAASEILEACSVYLYLSKIVMLKENTLSRKIEEYIVQHLKADLSVTALCEHFSISKNRLYELAEHNYGKGIAQYVRELRLDRAKKLLLDTNQKISDVAEECGFMDYNYFTKVFKKHCGMTPRAYKKEYATGKED